MIDSAAPEREPEAPVTMTFPESDAAAGFAVWDESDPEPLASGSVVGGEVALGSAGAPSPEADSSALAWAEWRLELVPPDPTPVLEPAAETFETVDRLRALLDCAADVKPATNINGCGCARNCSRSV